MMKKQINESDKDLYDVPDERPLESSEVQTEPSEVPGADTNFQFSFKSPSI